MNILYYVVSLIPFLVMISFVVFIHELGHYIAARLMRVRVEVFSVGFGPEIFGFVDRRGTRWRLALIPLGGYAAIARHTKESSALEGTTSLQHTPHAASERSLDDCHPLQQVFLFAAGPLFNYMLTFFLLIIVFVAKGLGALEGIHKSIMAIVHMTQQGFMVIGQLMSGHMKEAIGIVGIAHSSVKILEAGWLAFLTFTAVISFNLGFLNLLPVPILDGGGIVLAFIQWITGQKIQGWMERILFIIGVTLVGGVMLMSFWNDLHRLFWA